VNPTSRVREANVNILVVENYSLRTQLLIEGLNEATGCRVFHSSTLAEGLHRLVETRPDLILLNLDESHLRTISAVRYIRVTANDQQVRCPTMIVLGDSWLTVAEVACCRDLEATFMLREPAQPIYYEARIALWRRSLKKYPRTIRFERHSCSWSMHFCLGMSSRQILASTQLMRLALLLASGRDAYTVEEIADELRICRQSVKKYMHDLDCAVNLALGDLVESRERIFWMKRVPGGSLCGIKANVVFTYRLHSR
jgi:DNA-binding NarL/FixJ family response regulator